MTNFDTKSVARDIPHKATCAYDLGPAKSEPATGLPQHQIESVNLGMDLLLLNSLRYLINPGCASHYPHAPSFTSSV